MSVLTHLETLAGNRKVITAQLAEIDKEIEGTITIALFEKVTWRKIGAALHADHAKVYRWYWDRMGRQR